MTSFLAAAALADLKGGWNSTRSFFPLGVLLDPRLHSASLDLHTVSRSSSAELLLPHTGLTRSYFLLFNILITLLQLSTWVMTSLIKTGVRRLRLIFLSMNDA